MELIIDPEFKNLMPSLTADEVKKLEESIMTNGCRDPLVIWGNILLDGHNRHEICQHKKIEFKTHSLDLPDRDHAKIWIICNQLSRRNLSPEQKAFLVGIQYRLEKKEEHTGVQNDPHPGRTAEKIAAQHHVSPATVKRAEKFANAVDKLPASEKALILSGESGKSMEEVIEAGKIKKETFIPRRTESDELFYLKRYWDKATKRDHTQFLTWIKGRSEE